MKTKIIGSAISLVLIAVVYGVINLVLVGGQNVYHHDDQAKLDELKTELKDSKGSIKAYEDELSPLETELSDLKDTIDQYESDYPNGVPEESYDDYSQRVNDYNDQLSTYQAEYGSYTSEIDNYNAKVEEANAIAKKIGSTWYVIPIPGGKH